MNNQETLAQFQQLLGEIVHRLNNPLGAARQWILIIEQEKADLLEQDKDLAEWLQQIKKNVALATSLIADLRNTSKPLEPARPTSIKLSLQQALSEVEIPKSIQMRIEGVEDIPDVLATGNLVEVFRNLITNAVRAMPEEGIIEIATRANKESKSVEIFVKDTGEGIPPQIRESLFRSFVTTKKGEGHGLGLWWSKNYISSVGGHLELVSSELGQGTTFSITLPMAK